MKCLVAAVFIRFLALYLSSQSCSFRCFFSFTLASSTHLHQFISIWIGIYLGFGLAFSYRPLQTFLHLNKLLCKYTYTHHTHAYILDVYIIKRQDFIKSLIKFFLGFQNSVLFHIVSFSRGANISDSHICISKHWALFVYIEFYTKCNSEKKLKFRMVSEQQ